jgi:hypothetical protein
VGCGQHLSGYTTWAAMALTRVREAKEGGEAERRHLAERWAHAAVSAKEHHSRALVAADAEVRRDDDSDGG